MGDNPSAFPTHDQTPTTDPRERIMQGGMTLRDYFAGQALASLDFDMIATIGKAATADGMGKGAMVAAFVYDLADAMLAAREGDA